MIQRKALDRLLRWKESESRKPLVLRGARQVGKTTLVREFAKNYDVFIELNLENKKERELFETGNDVDEAITNIFFYKNVKKTDRTVLLFIDEIQFSKPAVAILRYFYEEANYIHVIVAGSLLETVIDMRKISFPVGRVQYMAIRPCSFLEYLSGIGADFDANLIETLTDVSGIHFKIIKHFYDYILVGGMPAAIAEYAKNKDILAAKEIYDSLLVTYKDDVEKYTGNARQIQIIRTILDVGWYSAAEAISYDKFGNTHFSSREMNEAFQTIQKAMLLELAYPTSAVQMPLAPNFRRRPKLLWLDTGLVNYFAGIQKEVFSVKDIQDVWRGRIAEHIVAQELLTLNDSLLTKRVFWRREKETASAEVDFVYNFDGKAIPIEVKSGHNSKLKSLHLFMDECPHDWAVRVWSQPFSIDKVKTQAGKEFNLINLPFYYVGVLEKALDKVMNEN
ncbi:MAG: AAA family ATPase [Planctomycetaceae bacterium]|jgi:predicted AAA+ superfamily ATPase|nr:AAA family ATPase [Planctomycetaceae bacterium]